MEYEIRADGSLHIEGYVNAVERDSRAVIAPECGRCVEQIKAGAFAEALRAADNVDLLLNHDKGHKAGSTSQGNLHLSEDNIGLRASADISDEEIICKARAGLLRGWSFGFRAVDTHIERRTDDIPRRHVTGLEIFEVSIIDDRFTPCYAGTSIEVRADGEELIETRFSQVGCNTAATVEPDLSDYIRRYNKAVLDGYMKRAALLGAPPNEMRFNPYHDDKGRFTSGGSGGKVEKGLDKSGKSGIIIEDEEIIGRSVGAKSKNYDVYDFETGESYKFVEGTRIQNPKVFAGKDGVKPLDSETAEGLAKQIGGKAENWQHVKGIGYIDFNGEERKAEVHWFQEETQGKHKFKVKEWLD